MDTLKVKKVVVSIVFFKKVEPETIGDRYQFLASRYTHPRVLNKK